MDMKELRLRSGKKAEELAVELSASVSTVRNWDQKRNAPKMTPCGIKRLMAAYGCTFDELVEAELAMTR